MRIVLFGPPGAGKGTQASSLEERRGLAHISTGVIIRSAIERGSDVGKQAEEYVASGQLVPDHIVQKLAEEAIARHYYRDFVLDGFPRTLEQAEGLSAFLRQHEAPLDVVISLQVPEELIVERLSKRRVHVETGANYHLDFNPPPDEVSEDMLEQRPDDRPEAVRKRLQVYKEQTQPVEQYYQDRELHVSVDGVGSIEEVYQRIDEVLEQVSTAPQ